MAISYVDNLTAKSQLASLSDEFVIVNNPSYIFPPFDIYALAAKPVEPLKEIKAVLMDMDGTTTSTEVLCLHSLEYMIRLCSGLMTIEQWQGLDHQLDYPNIIGNSTTKHVEFLINKYSSSFTNKNIINNFVDSAIWTIKHGNDENRKNEVLNNIKTLNFKNLYDFLTNSESSQNLDSNIEYLKTEFEDFDILSDLSLVVRVCVDIYYYRYHQILWRMLSGQKDGIIKELNLHAGESLISPMPGITVLLPLLKGKIESHYKEWLNLLINDNRDFNQQNIDTYLENFTNLCKHFHLNPAKISVVTSSIFYEANIVLSEVFSEIREKLNTFFEDKSYIANISLLFNTYQDFYDAVVTASDSNEIRLKPHRDLYSIALHKTGVKSEDFNKVIGFEDSESGSVAIRAAGVGMCVAVPFAQTAGHNLRAAAFIAQGGIPEVILEKNFFLDFRS